jgi:hypothetical protein
MAKPVRLQLSRKRGFNLQALSLETNGLPAVNVARPSKWGNPFKIGEPGTPDAASAVAEFRDLLGPQSSNVFPLYMPIEDVRTDLRGRNLACWCGDGPCHADVLLKLCEEV